MSEITAAENAKDLKHYDIKVLLIDDQPIVAETVRRMLASEKDIIFTYCQDPTKAIQVAVDLSPTLILQDLVMPDIDGMTLVKFIRAHPKLKDVPLIVLSSKEEPITKAEAFTKGANDYMVKLPDKLEVIARIRYHSKGYINLLERNDAYNKLAAELKDAANYVQELFPARIKEGPITTEWFFAPSSELGGDSFGYHYVDDDNFAFYLLDVSGHGVGAALLAVSAASTISSMSTPNTDFRCPDQVLAGVNKAFPSERTAGLFFTLFYGVYNKKTGELHYTSAGHHEAFLVPKTGDPVLLWNKNIAIGYVPDFPFKMSTHKVDGPAKIYLFSDGAFEISRPDGTMWDDKGLHKYLIENCDGKDSEIKNLHPFLQEMHGQPILDDDFSILKISFG